MPADFPNALNRLLSGPGDSEYDCGNLSSVCRVSLRGRGPGYATNNGGASRDAALANNSNLQGHNVKTRFKTLRFGPHCRGEPLRSSARRNED